MAINEGPFGTYTDVSGVVDATAQPEIQALLASFKGLIPEPGVAIPPAQPLFGQINAATATVLREEIDALAAAVAAAPSV